MNRDAITSSRYSPGNLPGELLERLFVAREPLLRDVLDRIASSLTRGSQYFQLLVGPRGAGKTHLLALLRHRTRLTEASLRGISARSLCVAPLNEEEWGVASYLDLLVRILQSIATRSERAAACVRGHRRSCIYRATRSGASHGDPDRGGAAHASGSASGRCWCSARTSTRSSMAIGDEGQKRWRAFDAAASLLEHRGDLTTPSPERCRSTSSFPSTTSFNVRQLDRLDAGRGFRAHAAQGRGRRQGRSGRRCSTRSMGTSPDARDPPPRGGQQPGLRDPRGVPRPRSRWTRSGLTFLRTIDDLTPYYQDRMRQLAPAQRKIVECLCLAGHPIIVKEIAARCLMTPQTAAKQLSELARLRYVLREQHGRESWYELAEPLMRICIDVKDNRTRHLRTFVELMRRWFSADEMRDRLGVIEREPGMRRPVDRLHLEAALEETKREGTSPHLMHLDEEATLCEQRGDHTGAAVLREKLVAERGWITDYSSLADSLSALDLQDKAESTLRNGIRQHAHDIHLHKRLAVFLLNHGRCDDALQALQVAPATRRDRDEIDAIKSKALRATGRMKEAIAIDRAIIKRGASLDVGMRADAFERLGCISEAISLLNQRLSKHPNDHASRDTLGWLLLREERWDLALQNETNHPTTSPLFDYSEFRRSRALAELGRTEEALDVLRRWVNRDPESARARSHLAVALFRQNRFSEALRESQEAQRLAPADTDHIEMSALCLLCTASINEALRLIDASIERAPLRGSLHALRGLALEFLGRLDEARHAFLTAAHLAERGQFLLLGVSRAWERGEWRWVLELCEAMPSTRPPTPSWSKIHARALVGVGRAEDALRLIDPLAAYDVEASSFARLAAFTLKPDDCDGPQVLAALASLPQGDQKDLWVFQLLLGVMGTHGASALTGLLLRLRASHEVGRHLAQSLSALLVFLSNRHEFITADMEHELPMLLRAIDGLPGSEVIGPALSVVVRYTRTHDPVVLLELPRELRELLLPALAPPAPVGATSDSSTHSPRAN
jgi:tetratricopeptide (TPR) repeat protein